MKELQGDSYTFTVKDSQGFEGLYTLREKEEEKTTFLDRVEETSKLLSLSGFEPVSKYKSTPIAPTPQRSNYSQSTGTPTAGTVGTGLCPNCGAEMKISKMGKPYCSKLCWKEKTY